MNHMLSIIMATVVIYNLSIYYGTGVAVAFSAENRIGAIAKVGLVSTIGTLLMSVFCCFVKVPNIFRPLVGIVLAVLLWSLLCFVCVKISFLNEVVKYSGICMIDSALLAAYIHFSGNNYNVAESITAGIAIGAGFTIVSIIVGCLIEKINDKRIPKAFRGLPMLMIIFGLLAMAFEFFNL